MSRLPQLTQNEVAAISGCGGAAIAIIVAFVQPKSPVATIFWSLLLFLLLLVPLLIFFRNRWWRLATIPILCVVAVLFGVSIWPSENGASKPGVGTVIESATHSIATYTTQLPWRWILLSLSIGIAVTAILVGWLLKRRQTTENKKPRVQILTPLDEWHVGSRLTIRGSVFPPEISKVQLLVRPWNEGWSLHNEIQVTGSAWAYNYRLDKPGISYEIVAVYGNSLKSPQYDDLPTNIIKSRVVKVHQRPNEGDLIDCPDKQLHQTRIDDKHSIKKLVRTCFVRCEPHIDITGDERQFVDFRFCILNLSLVEVSVKSVSGYITFTKVPYDETLKLEGAVTLEKNEGAVNRGFRSEGWFTVRQYLPDYQVRTIAAAPNEGFFYFHNLKIMVVGEGVDPFDLDVPGQVQKGIVWNAQDVAAQFVFVGEAERQDKLSELEAERDFLKSQNENCEQTSNRYKGEVADLRIRNQEQQRLLEKLKQCSVKFEIDAEQSRVHVTDGIGGCNISGDIRLRFENSAITLRTIKTLRLTLHQTNDSGEVQKIEARLLSNHVFFPEDNLGPLTRKGFEPMQIKPGTLTKFHRFKAELAIDSVSKSELVPKKHFLRMTMTAMEQPPFAIDIDVDWPRSSDFDAGVVPEIRDE